MLRGAGCRTGHVAQRAAAALAEQRAELDAPRELCDDRFWANFRPPFPLGVAFGLLLNLLSAAIETSGITPTVLLRCVRVLVRAPVMVL